MQVGRSHPGVIAALAAVAAGAQVFAGSLGEVDAVYVLGLVLTMICCGAAAGVAALGGSPQKGIKKDLATRPTDT